MVSSSQTNPFNSHAVNSGALHAHYVTHILSGTACGNRYDAADFRIYSALPRSMM